MGEVRAGLVLSIVMSVVLMFIAAIIAFVTISNVATVEEADATLLSASVTNETANAAGARASLNDTTYTLGKAGLTGFASPVITRVYNVSNGAAVVVNVANASVTAAGVLTNGTTLSGGWSNVSVSYTYTYKKTTVSTENLRANFTDGVNNVSEKLPTVFTIVAVVLILAVVVLLWARYMGMRQGGSAAGL